MNAVVAIVAGSAAMLSLVAVSRTQPMSQPPAPAEHPSARMVAAEQSAVLALAGVPTLQKPVEFQDAWGQPVSEFRPGELAAGESKLGDLLKWVAERTGMPLHVHWPRLEEHGVLRDSVIRVLGGERDLADLFRTINESIELITLDFRADRGVVEVADRAFFDRRELRLVTYDVGPILAAGRQRFEQNREAVLKELLETLHRFVSPDDWTDNGGEVASHTIVGDRLFIEAPPRMHRQIEWVLDQLQPPAADPEAPAADAGATTKVYALRHADAVEVLDVLRRLEAIREIDFSRFAVDARTNAIMGSGPEHVHLRVAGALAALDRPAE